MNISQQYDEAEIRQKMHIVLHNRTNGNGSLADGTSLTEIDYASVDGAHPTNSTAYMTASMFRNVVVPFICIFGGIGNTMALVTLLYRRLRHTSCNIYLALRSVSDTLFLLTLMAVWFDSVGVPFFHTNGVCQIVVFTSYVTSFLSVWSVAAITFENYIRICYPTKLNKFCTLYKAKRVVIVFIIVSVLIYQSSLWTTAVVAVGPGLYICRTKSAYESLYLILTFVDIAVTLLIPLVVILFISSCIIFSVIKSHQRRIRLRGSVSVKRAKLRFSSTPQAKVTRLLFAVSLTFLILHTPIHIIKLIMIVKIFVVEIHSFAPVYATLKKVFETMYYINFSANFVVFFICGESFRKVFWELFCRCRKDKSVVLRNVEQQTDLTFLNLVRKDAASQQKDKISDSGSAQSHIYKNVEYMHLESSVMLTAPSSPNE